VDIVEFLLKKKNYYPSSALQEQLVSRVVSQGCRRSHSSHASLSEYSMNDKTVYLEWIKFILGIDPQCALVCSKAGATALHYAAGAGGASGEVIGLLQYEHETETVAE